MARRIGICLTAVLLMFLLAANGQAADQKIEVSPVAAEAHLVKKVDPTYPPLAKASGIQGKVILNIRIAKDGSIADASVKNGHPFFVGSALQAVKQWRYKPYLLNGQPVEVDTTATVNIDLTP